jgi:hypothetical protein
MRNAEIERCAARKPKPPAHSDSVIRQPVAMPAKLSRQLDLRAKPERLCRAVGLDAAQQRKALVKAELTVARAVGTGIVEMVNLAATEPVDGVAELRPDVAASGCAQHFLERGDVWAARGDLFCDERAAARQVPVCRQVVKGVQREYCAFRLGHRLCSSRPRRAVGILPETLCSLKITALAGSGSARRRLIAGVFRAPRYPVVGNEYLYHDLNPVAIVPKFGASRRSAGPAPMIIAARGLESQIMFLEASDTLKACSNESAEKAYDNTRQTVAPSGPAPHENYTRPACI